MPSRILRATGLESLFPESNSQCAGLLPADRRVDAPESAAPLLLRVSIRFNNCRHHHHLLPALAHNFGRELRYFLQCGIGRNRRAVNSRRSMSRITRSRLQERIRQCPCPDRYSRRGGNLYPGLLHSPDEGHLVRLHFGRYVRLRAAGDRVRKRAAAART